MIPILRNKLLEMKAQQEMYQQLCGKSYNMEFDSKLFSAEALNFGEAFGEISAAAMETGSTGQPDRIEQKSPQELIAQGFQQI